MELRTDAFTDPRANLLHVGLKSGMTIVDLGSGSGHYAFAGAEIVGEKGVVYAIEVQKELMQRIKNEATVRKYSWVRPLWGDIEEEQGTKLADRVADVAVLSNTLFQLEDKKAGLAETYRILKPGGRLLIIDWRDSYKGMGPEEGQVITEAKAQELVEQTGFKCENTFVAGAHHYGLIALRQ